MNVFDKEIWLSVMVLAHAACGIRGGEPIAPNQSENIGAEAVGRPSVDAVGATQADAATTRFPIDSPTVVLYPVPDEVKFEPTAVQTSRAPAAPVVIAYSFSVKVVSGSLINQIYSGSFAYDPQLLTGTGAETIATKDFQFNYLSSTEMIFDQAPSVSFMNGVLTQLTVVGGPGTKRFGINTGFSRNQFGKAEEAFVRNGDQYFGYLNDFRLVEGAGTITYMKK
jgi:hypothetical protein